MHLSDKPSEKVLKASWGHLAFMAAIALSVSSCVSSSPKAQSEIPPPGKTTEMQDNPMSVALVSIGAEIRYKLQPDSTPQTLNSIKKYICIYFKEMSISYTRCDVTFDGTGGNPGTLVIDCDGETVTLPVAPGQIIENNITNNKRLDYLEGLGKRFGYLFGHESAEEQFLQAALEGEKEGLKHHRITPLFIPDEDRKGYFWIIFK